MSNYDWFNARETPRFKPDEKGTRFRWNNLVNVETDYSGINGPGEKYAEVLAREAWALAARVTELEKVVKELVEGFYQKGDETVVTNNFVMYNDKDQKIRGLEAQVEHLRSERDRAVKNARDADEVNARNRVFFEGKIASLENEVDELREARELLEEDLDNARAELGRYEQRLAEAHDYIVNAQDVLDMS